MLVYMPSPYWMRRSTKAAKLALRRAFTRPAARSVVNLSAAALARVVIGCPAFSRSLLSVCLRHRDRDRVLCRQPAADIALRLETTPAAGQSVPPGRARAAS